MDITTTTTTTSIKTPEAEAENPIRIQQPVKPLSFTNGILKRRHHHHHHTPPAVVTYRECLKNHAASLGGHAVDGCGEFMPSPTASQTDPTSLKCAACGCHRNFHRREPDEPHAAPPGTATAQHVIEYQPHHRHHPPPPMPRGHSSSPNSPSPPPISSAYYPSAPHMLLALSHGVSGPPPENNPLASPTVSLQNGRKRFRTKFTAEQKEKMQEFAEKVGWKMQKKDEELIGEFCNQVGVDKGVLKVWMHNNKSTLGKRERDAINNGNGNGNGNGNLDTTTTATHYHDHDGENHHLNISHHLHNSDDVVITNGSSSSS